jgi:hypothetical protein
MKMLRVFPRKTNATPTDQGVRFGCPGLFDEADEVNISVAFTYDLKKAEELYRQWRYVSNTTIGGPAINEPEGEFVPGIYLKEGLVITSRGCPNHCWFCEAWKRNGTIRELKINNGWNLMDDNILACSEQHIKSVFEMLKKQNHPIRFTGGLEARRLQDWHCAELRQINPAVMYFAYDTPDDYEPLIEAGKKLQAVGFSPSNHQMLCYVLMGYPKDTFEKAEKRCIETMRAGFVPFGMLWKNKDGEENKTWRRFQREWANIVITTSKMKKLNLIRREK